MILGPITPEQAAIAVTTLLLELAPDLPPQPERNLLIAKDLFAAKLCFGFAAEDEQGLAGAILANPCAAIYAGGRFGEITELWVRPDCRSQGIAARLVGKLAETARDLGWKRLEVGAPAQPEWARTLAFYQAQGFEPTGPRLRFLL